jgi:hypothetical protein
VVALLAGIVTLVLVAFTWPSVRSTVHDIPVAVAGPGSTVQAVTDKLEQAAPGAYVVTAVDDTAAAERAILDREVYGAIDVSTGQPQVLVASAASPVIAQNLRAVASGLGGAGAGAAPATPVTDVVPLTAEDPRGSGLAAAGLPMVMGGLAGAALLTNLVEGRRRRLVGALAYTVVAGLSVSAILNIWLGAIDGSFWAEAGSITLAIGSITFTILGLETLLGVAGLGLGAVLMMLLGNPLAGGATAPEMLPGWTGTLGQLLPPGAGISLLRSVSFFDGHGAQPHLWVLVGWLVLGLVLSLVGGLRHRRARAATAEPSPTPVPV